MSLTEERAVSTSLIYNIVHIAKDITPFIVLIFKRGLAKMACSF